jgi:hypothetical protein
MTPGGRNDAPAQEIRNETVSRAEDAMQSGKTRNIFQWRMPESSLQTDVSTAKSGECLRVRRN